MSQTDGAAAAAREARLALERLLAGTPALAASLPAGFADAIERYVSLLLDANRRLNLTRIVEPSEVARRHLLDSLGGLPIVDRADARSAMDLGSGGGLPGIPLALARPQTRWTLVDAVGRKADALRGFVETLGLPNVVVVAQRAEALGQAAPHREQYDLVAARACAALPVLAELALPLLRVGGGLLAWKGPLRDADDEVRAGRAAIGQLGGGRLTIEAAPHPALSGTRLVRVPKERATEPRYPRRPGVPARRPLA